MDTLSDRINATYERITAAARRAGRDPADIRLIGVTKTHPPELVRETLAAGLADFGENRVQEAEGKILALAAERERITWHLIGHLQTNKAKKAATLFDFVHSVDSVHLAEALDRHCTARLPILLQVNVSGEASKEGFDLAEWQARPAALQAFYSAVERILSLQHLRLAGLMTIAPWSSDPEAARETFRLTRLLCEALARQFPAAALDTLSMGMSDDFEIAIEEGATLVRVGRAIFGARE